MVHSSREECQLDRLWRLHQKQQRHILSRNAGQLERLFINLNMIVAALVCCEIGFLKKEKNLQK